MPDDLTPTRPAPTHNLAEADIGEALQVVAVTAPASAPDWSLRLAEIGFMPGEHVMIISRGMPGGDPLAVRVGLSTFALRRAEAACIRVAPRASTGTPAA